MIVVAHPDDEYAFAATTYRLVRESGWIADQVTITDGESGYRYSALAEMYYGVALMKDGDGHGRLAAIRKEEVQRAGKILGIRHQYFLDQKDLGFDTDASSAESGNWDRPHLRSFLSGLLTAERYDAIFTLLPTAETMGIIEPPPFWRWRLFRVCQSTSGPSSSVSSHGRSLIRP